MKKWLPILFISLSALALNSFAAETPAIEVTARMDLFNGKDFTGWTFFMKDNADPKNTWSVADGLT